MESTMYTVGGKSFELRHHGVKGMKWGVRRKRPNVLGAPYGVKGGPIGESRTPRGAKGGPYYENLKTPGITRSNREGTENSAQTRKTARRVATALLMTATAAAAVAYYRKNPQAVKSVLSKVGNTTVSAAKKAGNKTYEAGKKYVKDAIKGAKEGIAEGVREAPKKAAKTIVTGAAMMAAKRMLDATVGKEEAARIFQANNNKKIGSFWKVSSEDRDDD